MRPFAAEKAYTRAIGLSPPHNTGIQVRYVAD